MALIGYSVYLEIIELRFCELENDLKKNIIERGDRETEIGEKSLDQEREIDTSETENEENENIVGQSLQIIGNDSIVRSYPIFHVEKINNGLKIYTRYHSRGFRVYENVYYRIQNAKIVEEKINDDKKNEEENKKLSGFVIFLIVFGCILFIAIIIYLLYRCYKRKASGGISAF